MLLLLLAAAVASDFAVPTEVLSSAEFTDDGLDERSALSLLQISSKMRMRAERPAQPTTATAEAHAEEAPAQPGDSAPPPDEHARTVLPLHFPLGERARLLLQSTSQAMLATSLRQLWQMGVSLSGDGDRVVTFTAQTTSVVAFVAFASLLLLIRCLGVVDNAEKRQVVPWLVTRFSEQKQHRQCMWLTGVGDRGS